MSDSKTFAEYVFEFAHRHNVSTEIVTRQLQTDKLREAVPSAVRDVTEDDIEQNPWIQLPAVVLDFKDKKKRRYISLASFKQNGVPRTEIRIDTHPLSPSLLFLLSREYSPRADDIEEDAKGEDPKGRMYSNRDGVLERYIVE